MSSIDLFFIGLFSLWILFVMSLYAAEKFLSLLQR
jgi:uncharacterized membrane protein